MSDQIVDILESVQRPQVARLQAALAESTARADLAEAENAELRKALTALIDVDMALRDRIEAPMFLRARGIMVVQSAKNVLARALGGAGEE